MIAKTEAWRLFRRHQVIVVQRNDQTHQADANRKINSKSWLLIANKFLNCTGRFCLQRPYIRARQSDNGIRGFFGETSFHF